MYSIPTTPMPRWRSFSLEAFQWHGVKCGNAFAGNIRVEGPHPFSSSGGNLGNKPPVRPCKPTASSSSTARVAHARSGFGQRPC